MSQCGQRFDHPADRFIAFSPRPISSSDPPVNIVLVTAITATGSSSVNLKRGHTPFISAIRLRDSTYRSYAPSSPLHTDNSCTRAWKAPYSLRCDTYGSVGLRFLTLSSIFSASPNAYSTTISMFSSSREVLGLCTAILSSTASLPVPRFGTEHCRIRTSEIQAPRSAHEAN